jgi:hypothetical protein
MRLQQAADAHGLGMSDVIRQALRSFLDRQDFVNGTDHLRADAIGAPPHDRDACAQVLLTTLPPEVQVVVREKARLLNYPLSKVMTALLIAQIWPAK